MKKLINDELGKLCDQMIIDARLKSGIKYCLGLNGRAKRLRPLFCLATASDTNRGKISRQAIKTACSIEMLHCASLVLDDLQDNCEIRRGQMSAWKKFGVAESLMICHTMIALSFKIIDKKFLKDFSEVYFQMCLGQSLDLAHCEKMSMRVYKKIVANKTGSLFSFAMKTGARARESDNTTFDLLSKLGYLFGFLYQINDDLKDNDCKITKDMQREITTAENDTLQLLEQYTNNFNQKAMLLLPQIFKKNLLQ